MSWPVPGAEVSRGWCSHCILIAKRGSEATVDEGRPSPRSGRAGRASRAAFRNERGDGQEYKSATPPGICAAWTWDTRSAKTIPSSTFVTSKNSAPRNVHTSGRSLIIPRRLHTAAPAFAQRAHPRSGYRCCRTLVSFNVTPSFASCSMHASRSHELTDCIFSCADFVTASATRDGRTKFNRVSYFTAGALRVLIRVTRFQFCCFRPFASGF
jgi:hypothetical protein